MICHLVNQMFVLGYFGGALNKSNLQTDGLHEAVEDANQIEPLLAGDSQPVVLLDAHQLVALGQTFDRSVQLREQSAIRGRERLPKERAKVLKGDYQLVPSDKGEA